MRDSILCAVCGTSFVPISNGQTCCNLNCRSIKRNRESTEKWINATPEGGKKPGHGFRRFNINNNIFKNSQDEQVYKIRKKENNSEPIR